MMLRDTEAYFFAHFKSAIVGAKQELRGFVRVLVGQDDAAVIPKGCGEDEHGWCFCADEVEAQSFQYCFGI